MYKNFKKVFFSILTLFSAIAFSTSCASSKNGVNIDGSSSSVEASKITITWEYHGGSKTTEVDYGKLPNAPTDITTSYEELGYVFAFEDWSPVISVAIADTTYTALYSHEPSTRQYDITFDADNGTTPSTQKLRYGEYPTIPSNPTKDGYSFVRWNPSIDKVTKDQTYKAIYKTNQASITVNCTGCSVNGRTNYKTTAIIGDELTYHFDLASSVPADSFLDITNFTVDGKESNDYTYDNTTGDLKFIVRGSSNTITATTDNYAVKMIYDYLEIDKTVAFNCEGIMNKVDWGDGTINTDNSHTYSKSYDGDCFTIRIYGDIESIVLLSSSEAESSGNHRITFIRLTNKITYISNSAFRNCYALSSIDIPSSVTSIGDDAFYTCLVLHDVNIPNSVMSIGDNAFDGCASLQTADLSNVDHVISGGDEMFYACNYLKIIVPTDLVDAYKSAPYWSVYANKIVPAD